MNVLSKNLPFIFEEQEMLTDDILLQKAFFYFQFGFNVGR